jgi:hypothetical protein
LAVTFCAQPPQTEELCGAELRHTGFPCHVSDDAHPLRSPDEIEAEEAIERIHRLFWIPQ